MKIIKPSEVKNAIIDKDNSYIDKGLDYFNMSIIDHDYQLTRKNENDYFVIDVGHKDFASYSILTAIIDKLKEVGWDCFHDYYYNTDHAAPSYGIFIKKSQLKSRNNENGNT